MTVIVNIEVSLMTISLIFKTDVAVPVIDKEGDSLISSIYQQLS